VTFALVPLYVEAEKNCWQIGAELYARMIKEAKDTFVLLATERNGKIMAFLAAYVDNDHVHIWQARKLSGFGEGRRMLETLYVWAKALGFSRITLGCPEKRLRRLYKRKYGFTPTEGDYMEKRL
jgi:GNAT superfamily N-acetyltransferase